AALFVVECDRHHGRRDGRTDAAQLDDEGVAEGSPANTGVAVLPVLAHPLPGCAGQRRGGRLRLFFLDRVPCPLAPARSVAFVLRLFLPGPFPCVRLPCATIAGGPVLPQ